MAALCASSRGYSRQLRLPRTGKSDCDAPLLGAVHYFGNGRTPGKWIARTKIVSLTGERMGLWQSFERVLGYGTAVLELGVGFLQYFWDRNRMCAQDRLAETIVVDMRKRAYPAEQAGESLAESDDGRWARNSGRESDSAGPLH